MNSDANSIKLELSTGMHVAVPILPLDTKKWRRQLAVYIILDRLLPDYIRHDGLPPGEKLPFETVFAELDHLLYTTPGEIKDILLYQVLVEDFSQTWETVFAPTMPDEVLGYERE